MNRSVAVVTVTHNSAAHLDAMLEPFESRAENLGVPIIAVDNGSTDGTPDLLRGRPEVTLVEQSNTGYADGINRGIGLAPRDHDILVLNPDVVIASGTLERLAGVLDRRPDAAVAVPLLREPSGAVLPSLRRTPTWWRTLLEAVVGGTRAGGFAEAFRPEVSGGYQAADWATGAAMLIRRESLDVLGPWDPIYFLYSEETEFCLRARDGGWRLLCDPGAVATHAGGEMGHHPTLWALRAVNRVRLHSRRSGRVSAALFWVAAVAFELRRTLTGSAVSRAALRALLRRDLDASAVELTTRLGGDTTRMLGG